MEQLDKDTLRSFKEESGFVVCRTDTPFSRTSYDLCIEQTLMASIKGNMGITRGRGFTLLNRLIWMLSRPVVCKLDEVMRGLAGVEIKEGQSGVKVTRKSRIDRDNRDLKTLKTFFSERFVFDPFLVSSTLKNIATGLVSPSKVNVHDALAVGTKIIKSLSGQNPLTATIKKSELAVRMPLKHGSSDDSSSKKDAIDPNLLFQRALALADTVGADTVGLEECLRYELSSKPMSLFDDDGFMRSNDKSDLATHLIKESNCVNKSFNILNKNIVLDGGMLLHKIKWEKNATVTSIIKSYINYVSDHYGQATHIVFDGYLQHSTKDHCHKRRQPITGLQVDFNLQTQVLSSKELFLSNVNNKQKFVNLLSSSLRSAGHNVTNCDEDADLQIVYTALDKVANSNTVVVADDTDILILLLHYLKDEDMSNTMVMFRPSSNTAIDINELISHTSTGTLDLILLAHAASGCDTVSAVSGIGKTKLIKFIEKGNLGASLAVFYGQLDETQLRAAGTKMLIKLYTSDSKHSTMEEHRVL